jgi:thymidylate kinase
VYQFSTKLPEMWSMTCEDILPTARPEFIFWVDTPVEVAKTRRENRAGDTDAWEQGDMAARRTLYEDFYQESERLGLNIVRIDGTLPMHVQVREVLNHIAVDFAGNGGIDPTATLEDMDIQGLMMEGPYVPVLSTRLYPPPV